MEEITVKVEGKEYKVKIEELEGKLRIYCGKDVYEVKTAATEQESIETGKKEEEKEGIIKAPLPGIVYSIDVKEKQQVKKGERLMTIMSMKMENEIMAPSNGIVKEIKAKKNASIKRGDILLIIESKN